MKRELSRPKRKTLTKETWKHKDVFETFMMMGPGRNFKDLSKQTEVSINSLRSWSHQFGWPARLAEKDKRAITALSEENEKTYLEEVKLRHIKAYKAVQDKSLKYIEKKRGVKFENARDAAVALDIGIKGERDVLGLRDSKLKGAFVKEGFAAFVEATFAPE